MDDHRSDDATRARVGRCVIDAIISFGADAASVTPTASLADLDTDLLDILALSQVVQEEFGVRIRTGDAIELRTVGDAIEFVASRREV
jgi:acyl carrier protein